MENVEQAAARLVRLYGKAEAIRQVEFNHNVAGPGFSRDYWQRVYELIRAS